MKPKPSARNIECPANGIRIDVYFGGEFTGEWRA